MMTLEDFYALVWENSGVAAHVVNNVGRKVFTEAKDIPAVSSLFFKPYQSPLLTLKRGSDMVTDPIVIAGFAALELLIAVYYLFHSIWHAIKLDKETAIESIGTSVTSLIVMVAEIAAAAISPVVNLIDLIGGGIASLACDANEDVIGGPAYN